MRTEGPASSPSLPPGVVAIGGTIRLVIFYAIFFAPILLPKEQLPEVLQAISAFMPITYAADAMRGALTNLEGTNVPQDVLIPASGCMRKMMLSGGQRPIQSVRMFYWAEIFGPMEADVKVYLR